jgi:C4-dicarboxylate-binding protein DctP
MKGRVVCLLLASLLLSVGDADAQQVKLKANLQFPISHPVFGASLVRFKEEVEKRSKGVIAIEIFDKSQLYKDDQVVDAVASGAIDIGMTAAQQFSYKAPLVGVLDQPFLFNFPALMNAAASPGSEIRKLIDDAILSDIGVRVLWWHSLGNNVFFAKGRDVMDPAQLRGQRVASPGKLPAEFVTWCGGRPAVMTVEKFSGAFKGGALDMAMVSLGAIHSLGLAQFTDTITITAHSPVEFFLVINERTWQSLPTGDRAVMADAARNVERGLRDRLAEFESHDRALAASKGITIHELIPDQVAEWRACSAGMLAEFMDKNGQRAHELMDAYGRLRTQPCCTAAPGMVAFTRR